MMLRCSKAALCMLLVTACLFYGTSEGLLEVDVIPPGGVEITIDETYTMTVNYTNQYGQVLLLVVTEQEGIIDVLDNEVILNMTSLPATATFRIKAVQIGFAYVDLMYSHMNNSPIEDASPIPLYKISVVRTEVNLLLQDIFTYLLNVLLVLNNLIMGCKLEFQTIMKCIKKPYGIIIGLCSQFLIMPLLSFAFANAFLLSDIQAIALLTVGCAPGGGVSNMFSVLLEADLDLSVTMTTISLVLAMGLMPLWLIILGPYLSSNNITVPFENIALTLTLMIVPLGLGMLMRHFKPIWADKCLRPLRPFTLVIVVVSLGLGVYQAQYIFSLLTWEIVVSTMLLPISGFLLGGLLATVLAQQFKQVKAIALETGIQNVVLSITLIKYSYTQPNVDLGLIMPALVSGVTIMFMLCLTLVHFLLMKKSSAYRKLHRDNSVQENVPETSKTDVTPPGGGQTYNDEMKHDLSSAVDYGPVEKIPDKDKAGWQQKGSASSHSNTKDELIAKRPGDTKQTEKLVDKMPEIDNKSHDDGTHVSTDDTVEENDDYIPLETNNSDDDETHRAMHNFVSDLSSKKDSSDVEETVKVTQF